MATEHTHVSSYGPEMQITQTLPVQTPPHTQLLSHEVPQFTQLIDHDSVDHVHGDTLVSSSDLEGPGNTLVLDDDASPGKSKAGPSPPDQRDDAPVTSQATLPPEVGVSHENELHIGVAAEDCGTSNASGLAPEKKYITPDSDATTEEGDIDGFGYLYEETDAESLLHKTGDTEGDFARDNLVEQRTQGTSLVPDVTDMKSSELRPVNIQAVPLCDPELLAANQSASLDTVRKDDAKFDSSATVELTPGVFNSEMKDPFREPERALGPTEGPSMNKLASLGSSQPFPKAVLPSTEVSPQQALLHDPSDRINTIELDKNASQGLSSHGRVPEMPMNHPESMPTPFEPLTTGLKRQHSQESLESTKKLDQGVANDASAGATVMRKQPSPQNPRDILTDELVDAGNAVSNALETKCENASGTFVSVIHAPIRDERLSLASGFHAAPTNLSYLVSQEPGEETQLNAFDMVDKLVWLDTTCMPDDIVTSPAPQDGTSKDHAGAKGLRPLAQAAQMKAVRDNLDVFDWEDSQVDTGCTPPDAKQVSLNVGSQKQQSEAHKPMTARKKQATSAQKRKETTSQVNKGNDSTSAEREKTTLDVAKMQVPNLELSSSLEKEPHTLLTTRLSNRTKTESRPLLNAKKGSSFKKGPSKRAGKGKEIDESGKGELHKDDDNVKLMVQQAGLNEKGKSRKRAGRKKAGDNLGKDLQIEQLNVNDDIKVEVQQSGSSVKREVRKRAGGKKAVDQSGKDDKTEQLNGSDNKENKSVQAATLSAKGKEEVPKISKLSPVVRGSAELAQQTSQDDAAADIWIEAFASTKNKTPMGGKDGELIKFRKRSALHEDIGQDSKKSRIIEPSTVEETLLKETRVEPKKSQRDFKKLENFNAKVSWHEGRRVGTRRHSKEENQELAKKGNNVINKKRAITKSKEPRIDDTQVKARRIRTRSGGEKHQDVPMREDFVMKENKAERGLKRRQDSKQCKTADVVIMPSMKGLRISTRSSERENFNIVEQAGNAKCDSTLESGPKTRSRDKRAKSIVADSEVEEGKRAKNDVIKSSTAQSTTNDKDQQSLPSGAKQGDFEEVKPSIQTRRSKEKEKLSSHQHLTAKLNQKAEESEAGPCQAKEGVPAEGPRRRSRRREADACVLDSAKAVGKSAPQPKEDDIDKAMLKLEDLVCSKLHDGLKLPISRRTRSNTHNDGSQSDTVDINKDRGQSRCESATEKQTLQNHNDIFYADKGLKEEEKKSETKTTKSVSGRNKKRSAPEKLKKLNSSARGKRRKTDSGCIRVLFSHSLSEDIIKHQKKILTKLGGQVVMSASDCTHFVSNGFVRTQNMLISMAAGKIVATPQWLENCGQAHYFVDAKKYILQDKKKEKEVGFSMIASLASAEQKPLLKGVQVLVCPNTVPEPAVLQGVVENAGGQVVDIKSSSSLPNSKESDTHSTIIIANEKDFDFCHQFLEKGWKVYSEELLLHGIVTQSLYTSRHHLFEDFKRQGRRRAAKISA